MMRGEGRRREEEEEEEEEEERGGCRSWVLLRRSEAWMDFNGEEDEADSVRCGVRTVAVLA